MTMIPRFWRDLPLASKIALFASALVALIVPILNLLTIQRERDIFQQELEGQARLLVGTLSGRLEDNLYTGKLDEIQEVAEATTRHTEVTQFKVYDEDGKLQVDATNPEIPFPTDVEPLPSELLSLPPDQIYLEKFDQYEILLAQSIWIGDERVGVLRMGFSTAPLNQSIRELTEWSITLAASALITGILMAALMARQLTNPIRELTWIANKMAAGNLATRFHGQGKDEIGQLGRAFNDLASAIEKRETDLRNSARGLEQAVNDRTRELQQQNQYLGALHEVTLGLIENLEVERLLEAIMTRAASLVNTEHAFVSIVDSERSEIQIRVAQGRYRTELGTWFKIEHGLSGRVMASGQMMIEDDYQQFEGKHSQFDWLRTAIYVPLRSESTIFGAIGLGYDKVVAVNPNHVEILHQFAQLASLALKNAQLYSAAQKELSVTGQALLVEEERRKAYLISPQGRAESMVQSILKDPSQTLIALHDLTQNAEKNSNAMILTELPGVLELAGQALLARLAEGFHYIYRSQTEPELLTVGLRQLRTGLGLAEAQSLLLVEDARTMYGLCHQAIEAGSVHAITEMLPSLHALHAKIDVPLVLTELTGVLNALLPVAESLHAYERVDSTQDRRDYLARAVEWLSHADRLANALHPAEQPIARRIIENWMAIVTGSIHDLQNGAHISCRLLSHHTWKEEMVAVALQLRNEGHGMALNLRVTLAESPDYKLIDERIVVDRLAPGEEAQIEFRVCPQLLPLNSQFRAWFVILYDDPRGPNHVEHFADVVHLLAPESAFQFIPNPYVAGTPLEAGSPLFFGREDLFSFIGENLNAAYRNNLVLIGQRRTGKSSLLKQLPIRLGQGYVPVYLDGQSIALDPGLPAFFSNLTMEICFALEDCGFSVTSPALHEFSERPAYTFEHDFLRRVRSVIGDRHLVLLLDEFEELEAAAKSGNLDASIFGFLRHLIQHELRLSVIFCGTHRMEELATDYWSVLFNISLYKHVGFLAYDDAARLIQEPVAGFGMHYDDLALDKMWRVTAGHPYFLQLLCHSLVNQHNRAGRSYATVSDVNTALSEILSSGEAHFIYLWNESSRTERLVLTAMSRIMTLTGHVTPAQIQDYLNERGISLDRHIVVEALHHLTLRDILSTQVDDQPLGIASTYSWRLGLLGLWIEKFKSLSLLQEETPQ